jgi:hypothetical protein
MRKILRWVAPFAITLGALVWVFQRVDFQAVSEQLTPGAFGVMVPALIVFGIVALFLEAECLAQLLPAARDVFDRGTAARIKAASYPLALVHYAIGAGTLAVLLSRRTGRTVADAAGVVGLISLFDIGIQLIMLVIGLTALGTSAPAARSGVAVGLAVAIGLGFLALRTRASLGPLDRIRELSVFDAARTTPIPKLLVLGSLRVLFALVFVSLIGVCCSAFDLDVPWMFLFAAVPLLIVVAMIPSVAGLGTGQVAFVSIFGRYGDEETLLACSLAFSTGLIVMRAGMGLLFAREFTREAFATARHDDDEAADETP